MSGRRIAIFAGGGAALALALVLVLRPGGGAAGGGATKTPAQARMTAIGPRVISNQADYPVMIWGEGLTDGMTLVLADTKRTRVPTRLLDDRHLTARLPAGIGVLPELSSIQVLAVLEDREGKRVAGETRLTVVNDAHYPMPYAMELLPGPKPLPVVASPTTDELRVLVDAETTVAMRSADAPRAFARHRDAAGTEWLVVAHERGRLELLRAADLAAAIAARTSTVIELAPEARRSFAVAADLQDVAVDSSKGVAYVTSRHADRVLAVDLETGEIRARLPCGVNPRYLTLAEGGTLAIVANVDSQDLSIVDLSAGTERRVRPGPGASIIGGHTEPFSKKIMGDSAARAVVYDEARHVAFAGTLGPNIGPNTDRMEVTMSSGVSVIDARNATFLRHVSILGGVVEALVLDAARGLLFAADGATGRVVILDAARLAAGDAEARTAILGAFHLPRPEKTPLIRPAEDFGVNGRATESLHFGAKALRLEGGTLWVMGRFTGVVLALDTTRAREGKLAISATYPSWIDDHQRSRRRGEVIYFTDLGNSRMTCDTCHHDGHSGGIMFSKGQPMRIYRAPTVRAIRESPPYFTPIRLPSIRRTIHDVLARNRFYNPRPTKEEIDDCTEYTGAVAVLPNPNLGPEGELPPALELPDGARGDARAGLALFEGKAGCAAATCHPPPSFTADQKQETRGQLLETGTPVALMLRPEEQDLQDNYGQPPVSLLGVWDTFPLFLSGAGGNEVTAEGTIAATRPFALRWVLENPEWAAHGNGPSLSETERNDLLAYLLTL